jgi:hypothetical protein
MKGDKLAILRIRYIVLVFKRQTFSSLPNYEGTFLYTLLHEHTAYIQNFSENCEVIGFLEQMRRHYDNGNGIWLPLLNIV